MLGKSLSTANYAAVIKDLRAKRDEIDRTIAVLEAIARTVPSAAGLASLVVPAGDPGSLTQRAADLVQQRSVQQSREPRSNPIGANGIGEAVARVLEDAGDGASLSTREVTDRLVASGFKLNTANPVNNVWSALSHRVKVSKDVQRDGKNWRFVRRSEKEAEQEANHMNGANA